mmetsp:Transcript_10846/g.16588  ORF Transcript_10846/g.16588 Transcript_10846/m.16588 type:complete len:418 (+) Transcript_10846:13-1266(+)
MASRSPAFLKASDREALLLTFAKYVKQKENGGERSVKKEGCRVCSKDNDHSNMLICEKCSAEYHFYCIGLKAVPRDDWFCDGCEPESDSEDEDGLDLKVAALPPRFTSRFGEIVFAQGGSGYGMWPCYIYDPRMTVGGARELAKKNLGRKHLVYFFHCLEAPFAALAESKIVEWYEGLTENFNLGKAAKHHGKKRALQFAEALKLANIELGKIVERRMDWNHPEPIRIQNPTINSNILLTPEKPRRYEKKRRRKSKFKNNPKLPSPRNLHNAKNNILRNKCTKGCNRTNLLNTLAAHNEFTKDGDNELYLRVMRQVDSGATFNIGFVKFGSKDTSTFADARQAIMSDFDPDCFADGESWKFLIPGLGPISLRQESCLGPLLQFLQKASTDTQLGDGTILRPVKVLVIKSVDTSTLTD